MRNPAPGKRDAGPIRANVWYGDSRRYRSIQETSADYGHYWLVCGQSSSENGLDPCRGVRDESLTCPLRMVASPGSRPDSFPPGNARALPPPPSPVPTPKAIPTTVPCRGESGNSPDPGFVRSGVQAIDRDSAQVETLRYHHECTASMIRLRQWMPALPHMGTGAASFCIGGLCFSIFFAIAAISSPSMRMISSIVTIPISFPASSTTGILLMPSAVIFWMAS